MTKINEEFALGKTCAFSPYINVYTNSSMIIKTQSIGFKKEINNLLNNLLSFNEDKFRTPIK